MRFAMRCLILVLLAFSLTCHSGGSDDTPPPTPLPSIDCADLILEVVPTNTERLAGFGTASLPKVAVDLSKVSGVESTTLTFEPCVGGGLVATIQVPGGASFWIDENWFRPLASAQTCFRLSAHAFANGLHVGGRTALVRRGDFTLNGTLQPAAQAAGARVEVLIDGTPILAKADEQGLFTLKHLPGGKITLVRAVTLQTPLYAGEATPFVQLETAHPTAAVAVDLKIAESPLDRFEPDDTVALADQRQVPSLGVAERHNLPSKSDVDVVPFGVASGNLYQIKVTPVSGRSADLVVVVSNANGDVLAHVNDDNGAFMALPKLRVRAGLDGKLFARISRNDDEGTDLPYDIQIDNTWEAP